jgi:hypothetical protein
MNCAGSAAFLYQSSPTSHQCELRMDPLAIVDGTASSTTSAISRVKTVQRCKDTASMMRVGVGKRDTFYGIWVKLC